jgi:hypothetical protein
MTSHESSLKIDKKINRWRYNMTLLPQPVALRLGALICTGFSLFVIGCANAPQAPVAIVPAPQPQVALPLPKEAPPNYVSQAPTPREYRRDAASHLYKKLNSRIYQGKMPPLLQAVGVLQVDIGPRGEVTEVRWMRAPDHVPAVMAEIERAVKDAAPYPAPIKMGRVTYTDTWLWHKSGRFQLDTLSEGQL